MLNELVNRLRGQVWIRAESAFPERVLNLCGARDLAFGIWPGSLPPPLPAASPAGTGTRCAGPLPIWSVP